MQLFLLLLFLVVTFDPIAFSSSAAATAAETEALTSSDDLMVKEGGEKEESSAAAEYDVESVVASNSMKLEEVTSMKERKSKALPFCRSCAAFDDFDFPVDFPL